MRVFFVKLTRSDGDWYEVRDAISARDAVALAVPRHFAYYEREYETFHVREGGPDWGTPPSTWTWDPEKREAVR